MEIKPFIFYMVLLFGMSNISYGQQVNLNQIYDEIKAKHSIDLNTVNVCEMVVWNGIPYSSDSIEQELMGLRLSDFQFMSIGKLDYNTFPHANCDYIVILGSGYKQKKKEKKILIDSVINELVKFLPKNPPKDYSCSECILVIVNQTQYDPYQAIEFLKAISPRKINYIQFYTSPDTSVYGENAKNGLVDIRLESNLEQYSPK